MPDIPRDGDEYGEMGAKASTRNTPPDTVTGGFLEVQESLYEGVALPYWPVAACVSCCPGRSVIPEENDKPVISGPGATSSHMSECVREIRCGVVGHLFTPLEWSEPDGL